MNTLIKNIKENYKLVVGVLIVGMILGWLLFPSTIDKVNSKSEIENHDNHEHESDDQSIWTCSMHPQIRRSEPGDCSICGMHLIPLSNTERASSYLSKSILEY